MTRIEYQEISPAKPSQAAGWQKEPSPPRRWLTFRRGCCLLIVFLFLAGLFLLTVAVAKTGIVKVPLISDWFYQKPAPIREVTPQRQPIDLTKKLLFSPLDNSVVLKLSEQELTTLANQGLSQQPGRAFQKVQVAITAEQLELFGQLTQPVSADITLGIKPSLAAGKLNFELTKVKIGNILLPPDLIEKMVKNLLGQQLEQLNQVLGDNFQLKEIILREGEMEVKGKISN